MALCCEPHCVGLLLLHCIVHFSCSLPVTHASCFHSWLHPQLTLSSVASKFPNQGQQEQHWDRVLGLLPSWTHGRTHLGFALRGAPWGSMDVTHLCSQQPPYHLSFLVPLSFCAISILWLASSRPQKWGCFLLTSL